jgi:hypothetical protein
LGNKAALKGNEFWRDLIVDAERRGVFIDCGPNTFARSNNVPAIRSSGQGTPVAIPTHKKGNVKAKADLVMGEMIPLGSRASGSRKHPVKIDSDVEMRDVDDSTDSELLSESDLDSSSGSLTAEEGEIEDVEMADVVHNIPPQERPQSLGSRRELPSEPEVKEKKQKPRRPSAVGKNVSDHKQPDKRIKKSQTDPNPRKVRTVLFSSNY